MRALIILAALPLALAACSSGRDGESADDFAARVGGQDSATGGQPPAGNEDGTPAATPPPAGVDVTQIEKLGNIAGADLGQRDGGCTFQSGETELMLAGAPADPSAGGKAVVRLGGKLYLLTMASGGMPAVRSGGTFTAEGMSVFVAPAAGPQDRRPANLTVTDSGGASRTVGGEWICA
jgi:hypothetical protein